jgi:multidrug efflux pump subunit AcrA (membrane-fusion protein)
MRSSVSHRAIAPVTLPFLLVFAACSTEPPTAGSRPAVQATLGRVETVDMPSHFESGGTLIARETAAVSSRILAPVTVVHVRAGDRVRRGQPLIELDAREARANVARASSAVQTAEEGARAAEADARAADAALILARATHDRISALQAKQSATAQELDEATAALAAAEARTAAARARVSGAASALDEARAALESVNVALSYATLSAPFDGVVAARHIDPGTVAAPGQPLLVVEDPSAFRFEVNLDESRASGISVGQAVNVVLDGGDGNGTDAKVVEIARIDPAAHSFLVKIDLPSRSGLRSGLFGRARFAGPTRPALAVPATAIVRRGQLVFAFVVTDAGVARLRAISAGDAFGEYVEVLAGLADGESVVLSPPSTLVDGTPIVQARGAGSAAAAGASR